jgi:hypothetical protein
VTTRPMSLDDVERGWRALLLAREPTLMGGADEARQHVYRRLVRNNISGSIRRGMPILRKIAGEERVDVLITRFLDEVAPKTRLVRFVAVEFAQWLMENLASLPTAEVPHDAAGELAHWETLEIDVVMAADAEPPPVTATVSFVPRDDARVDMHPSARLAAYRHAVHAMTTSTTSWPAPSSTGEPYILLAWRQAERFMWLQLDGGTAKILVETAGGATVGEAIARVTAALTEGDVLDVPRVKSSLVDLCRRGAITGFASTRM